MQVFRLQSSETVDEPAQFSPMQDRLLERVPPPQSTLHEPHVFQSAHVPFK